MCVKLHEDFFLNGGKEDCQGEMQAEKIKR